MNIKEAVETRRGMFEQMFTERVRFGFNQLVEEYGVNMMGKAPSEGERGRFHNVSVYNSVDYSFFKYTVSPCCETFKIDTEGIQDRMGNSGYRINEAKLEANAKTFAQNAIDQWLTKINSKIGSLTNVTVNNYNLARFDILGQSGELNIRIEQDCIINRSVKGLLFNQYPARIYVDGKFISEAKFKALRSA